MNWYQKMATYLPVLHVSDDEQFGDIVVTTKKEELRYSLLAIWFGKYLIHIISIKKGKPSLVKVLDLDEILDEKCKVNEESIKKYTEALNSFNEKTIRDHIEALKVKIDEQQNRNTVTLNKIAIYNAALLVVLTIAFPKLLKLYQIKPIEIFILILFGLVFYISALMLSFKMIEVSSFRSFTFNQIKDSPDSMRSFASGLYHRYRNAQSEGDKIVSYNTNLQKNIRQFLAWSVIFVLAINCQGLIESDTKLSSPNISTYQSNPAGGKNSNLHSFTRVEEQLLKGEPGQEKNSGVDEQQGTKVQKINDIFIRINTSVNISNSSSSSESR